MGRKLELSHVAQGIVVDDVVAVIEDYAENTSVKYVKETVDGKPKSLVIRKDIGLGHVVISLKVEEIYLEERTVK